MKIHLLIGSYLDAVLTTVMAELGREHDVAVFDSRTLPAGYGWEPGLLEPPGLVLLESRSEEARRVALTAELAGSLVVNSPAATTAALDRATVAEALEWAGVPAPRTWSVSALRHLAYGEPLPWPLVVKGRRPSRRDFVRLVGSRAELVGMCPEWGDEPIVAQQFAGTDGVPVRVWVIGQDLSAARRRTPLDPSDGVPDELLGRDELPAEWTHAVRAAGAALGLELYDVDLVITGGRPVVVDVTPFPGFRGAQDPAASLLSFLSTVEARLLAA
jgi:ribosomal protein S6--L-glutamate ligase